MELVLSFLYWTCYPDLTSSTISGLLSGKEKFCFWHIKKNVFNMVQWSSHFFPPAALPPHSFSQFVLVYELVVLVYELDQETSRNKSISPINLFELTWQ